MTNRPSQRQMEALLAFLEQNAGIAKGLLRSQQGKSECKRKWQEFATTANALGGVLKNGPAWSKYWAEKKCALKRLCQQQAQSMRRTGEGIDTVPQLSTIEERFVAIMGGQSFATGDCGLAVDPFPHRNLQERPINYQPYTSFNIEIEGSEVEDETNQVESSHVQAPLHTARSRQRGQRRRRFTFLEAEVARFEAIETRRVEAEVMTARALKDIAAALQEMARLLSTNR